MGLLRLNYPICFNLFNAGSIYFYFVSNKKQKKPFKKGSYRYNILKNDATQKAFPLIKQLFDSKNPYIAKCEETIRFLKKMNTDNAHDKDTNQKNRDGL